MCNWSQTIEEMATERGIKKGIEQGIEKERLNAIERMLRAGATKEQIILYGYTEEELLETEKANLVNA